MSTSQSWGSLKPPVLRPTAVCRGHASCDCIQTISRRGGKGVRLFWRAPIYNPRQQTLTQRLQEGGSTPSCRVLHSLKFHWNGSGEIKYCQKKKKKRVWDVLSQKYISRCDHVREKNILIISLDAVLGIFDSSHLHIRLSYHNLNSKLPFALFQILSETPAPNKKTVWHYHCDFFFFLKQNKNL